MQYTHSFNDIEFLVRTSTDQQIADKFGVDVAVVGNFTRDGDSAGLSAYLESLATQTEEEAPASQAPEVVFETRRVDFGYEVTPRGKFVFIRPVQSEHPARIVFPKSHQSDQEIGFIHASVIADLPVGALVVYDRFSAIGAAFDVVDDSGEPCYVVQVDEAAVSGILQRRELN